MTPEDLIKIVKDTHLNDQCDVLAEDDAEDVAFFSSDWYLRECQTAQRQAFIRGDLRHVFDDETEELCVLTLKSGISAYALDERVLRIADVYYGSTRLGFTTKAVLDRTWPTWRQATGAPRQFYVVGRKLRPVPVPSDTEDGSTLSLSVYRMPLCDPELTDEFEWPFEQQELSHWVAHCAFLVPNNTPLTDGDLSQYHFEKFNIAFGVPLSHRARLELLEKPETIDTRPTRCRGVYSSNDFWRF